MKVGSKVKINKINVKLYDKKFDGFYAAFLKWKDVKKNDELEVIFYDDKMISKESKSKLCEECPLKEQCDGAMLDVKGGNIGIWCATLFEEVGSNNS